MAKLLILDDDEVCCTMLARLLASEGHEVQCATSGQDALNLAENEAPDLLMCDWILNDGLQGMVVATKLHARWPRMRIIFMTGLPADELREETKALPVVHILEKPLLLDHMLAIVQQSAGGS